MAMISAARFCSAVRASAWILATSTGAAGVSITWDILISWAGSAARPTPTVKSAGTLTRILRRGPAGDAVGFVIAAFGFGTRSSMAYPTETFLTDAIHHVAENLLGPRASPEADDGATYPVGVDAD